MDANEYALKVTPATQSLAVLLNRAEWCGESRAEAAKEETRRRSPLAAAPARSRGARTIEITMRHDEPPLPRPRALAKNLEPRAAEGERAGVAPGGRFHVDTLDLYSARQRAAFIKQAADELRRERRRSLKRDLGRVLLKLEELQDEQIRKALEAASPRSRR